MLSVIAETKGGVTQPRVSPRISPETNLPRVRGAKPRQMGKLLDETIRKAARALASQPDYSKLNQSTKEHRAAVLLSNLGEDSSDPLVLAMTVEEADRLGSRKKKSILGELKEVMTLYDKDLAETMGAINRVTINAYVHGRLQERFDEHDIKALKSLIDERIAKLQAIRSRLG